jgi:hypothetical protein
MQPTEIVELRGSMVAGIVVGGFVTKGFSVAMAGTDVAGAPAIKGWFSNMMGTSMGNGAQAAACW